MASILLSEHQATVSDTPVHFTQLTGSESLSYIENITKCVFLLYVKMLTEAKP